MNDRIEKELALLKAFYPKVKYHSDGHWVLIEDYPIPSGSPWNHEKTNVCFQIPVAYPGAPPYGFYVPSGMLYHGETPLNYREPANNKPPFSGTWGVFSWAQGSGWHPTDNPDTGSNLLGFVRTFRNRFLEGR